MSPETYRRVDCVLIALGALRRKGIIPTGQPVSPRLMASISREIEQPVSESTFRRLERRALTKARLAMEAYQSRLTQP